MAREDLQPPPRDRAPRAAGQADRVLRDFERAAGSEACDRARAAASGDGKSAAPGTAATKPAAAKPKPTESVPRLVSLDAFRGFIMLAMVSGGLALGKVFGNLKQAGLSPDTAQYKLFEFLKTQTDHVAWTGGVFWDLIQPAFMFMVGVALPYSYARRAAGGESYVVRLAHTLLRSLILVALGVFLNNPTGDSSRGYSITNFAFANVLAQIGLGYTFVFFFVNRGLIVQAAAIALICGGWWYAFYQHPLPPEGFDYATVGIPATVTIKEDGIEKEVPNPELEQAVLPGMKGHWSKNTNFAAEQDRKILNWFPRNADLPQKSGESDAAYDLRRQNPFRFNTGGYTTLNFVPSMATMLLGLIIGELLRKNLASTQKLKQMAIIGAVCLALGLAAGFTVCPIVKRIWTPSWALASGGIVVWMLAGFYLVFDHWNGRRLAWPLVVVGMNSIVIYMMAQMMKGWTLAAIKTHLAWPYAKFAGWMSERTGSEWNPTLFGGPTSSFAPMYESAAVLFAFWLVCVWLWKQKIFVKI